MEAPQAKQRAHCHCCKINTVVNINQTGSWLPRLIQGCTALPQGRQEVVTANEGRMEGQELTWKGRSYAPTCLAQRRFQSMAPRSTARCHLGTCHKCTFSGPTQTHPIRTSGGGTTYVFNMSLGALEAQNFKLEVYNPTRKITLNTARATISITGKYSSAKDCSCPCVTVTTPYNQLL